MSTAGIGKGGSEQGPEVTAAQRLPFACPECGERLDIPCWHCDPCDKHIPADLDACPDCETARPAPPPLPSAESGHAEGPGATAKPADVPVGACDRVGIPLDAETAEAFAVLAEADRLKGLYREIARTINRMAGLPGGEQYRKRLALTRRDDRDHWHCRDLGNSLRELLAAMPYCSVCPYHVGRRDANCQVCRGLLYVNEEQFNRAPEDYRRAVLALARGNLPAAASDPVESEDEAGRV